MYFSEKKKFSYGFVLLDPARRFFIQNTRTEQTTIGSHLELLLVNWFDWIKRKGEPNGWFLGYMRHGFQLATRLTSFPEYKENSQHQKKVEYTEYNDNYEYRKFK